MTASKDKPGLSALPLKQDYSEADMQERLDLLRSDYDDNDGKPETELSVSASKFKAFESCPRIWYQGNVLKAYTSTTATEAGKKIHAQIEDHYKHGQVVSGPAATAMRFYPLRKQSQESQFSLEAPFKATWAGAVINGVVDLIAKPGTSWPSGVIPNGGLYRILDLKTSSNIDEYCLKQSQLLSDRQLAIYARNLMDRFGISTVEISQVQVNRKAPYSGRMLQPELMTLGRARGIEVDDVPKVNMMRSLRNALPDVKSIPIPDWEAQGQKRPCDNHYGKRCPYYEVCHGRVTFAQMAANQRERVESESNLLAQLVAPTPVTKQEQAIMAGITSPQASNATILYPEEGSWTVENGVAIWKGKLNGHDITFRSKGKKAKISLDGASEEVLPDAADFMPNAATGHGNVDDLRKHFLYPALERLRQSYGMPSMFGAPVTQTQASSSCEDDAVLAALTAEAHAGEEANQPTNAHTNAAANGGAQADTASLVAELQSIYNTVPAETLAQWVAAGLTLHYMTTAPKEEVLERMAAQPKCGPTRAATRLEKVAHLRKDATAAPAQNTTTQAPAEPVKTEVAKPEAKADSVSEIVKPEIKSEVKTEPSSDTLDLTLYIRCIPLHQQYIAFEMLIDSILPRVAELGGKKHWMQVAAFDLPKHLITALDEQPQTWLAEKASGRPVVVTNTDSSLWRAISHVLITTAKEVIIGL